HGCCTTGHSGGPMSPFGRLLSASLVLWFGAEPLTAQAPADSIRIISVAPDTLVRGVPVILRVEVETVLRSAVRGVIRVGFNTTDPYGWHLRDSLEVDAGRHRSTFTTRTIPVDWQPR